MASQTAAALGAERAAKDGEQSHPACGAAIGDLVRP
jgi:hypothetical protein